MNYIHYTMYYTYIHSPGACYRRDQVSDEVAVQTLLLYIIPEIKHHTVTQQHTNSSIASATKLILKTRPRDLKFSKTACSH